MPSSRHLANGKAKKTVIPAVVRYDGKAYDGNLAYVEPYVTEVIVEDSPQNFQYKKIMEYGPTTLYPGVTSIYIERQTKEIPYFNYEKLKLEKIGT